MFVGARAGGGADFANVKQLKTLFRNKTMVFTDVVFHNSICLYQVLVLFTNFQNLPMRVTELNMK